MHDPSALRKLLNLVISTVFSSSGNYERVSQDYRKIVDFDELTAAAERLLGLRMDKDDDSIVSRYMEALKAARNSSF